MSDIVKTFWGKLYAWALPSTFFVGAFWLLVYPSVPCLHGAIRVSSSSEKSALFVAITALIAFTLNSCSAFLYRVLEGYLLWPKCVQKVAIKRQLRLKHELQRDVDSGGWARGLALEKLARYPMRDEQVVPTRFGNAIRSFETYGKTRFNLDSQTLWYELCASAPKYLQSAIETARSSVDFFVAMTYLSFLFGLTSLFLALSRFGSPKLFIVSAGAFGLTLLSHWFAVRTTAEWSYSVQALVNIGRIKLAEQLGLRVPDTLEAEKEMWGFATSYVFWSKPEIGAKLDPFRTSSGNTGKVAEEKDSDAEDGQD
ncbi:MULTISPECIES: hypothetical protein [unclassified Bradyrhizobium]|uniref:hypothetical protein n=1 Tax=unclassified Bradyrhizobium TaxID=2631580 RepID=UPI002FEFD2D5